jgi:hypothetical protein
MVAEPERPACVASLTRISRSRRRRV